MVYQSVDKILSLPNILYLGESLISWNTTSLHRSMLTAQWGVQGSHNAVSSPFTAVSLNLVFSWEPALWLANSQGRVRMRRMSQKSIDIFNSKQRLLSLDIKTKIVQRVPTINISIWHVTCDMLHATCYIITNSHFWAYTWKQKLFRTFKH